MNADQGAACLLGALVADAAALGLHWIYDVDRIADVAARHGGAAFTPLDPAHFAGVPAYFAHGARRVGQFTQYGEGLRLALRTMAGGLDVAAHQAAYAAHFGPGGAYVGYIDKPTRGTLAHLAAGATDPSGVDDDQLPALVTIPAVVVATGGHPTSAQVQAAVAITNANDTAQTYGAVFADLLTRVLDGADIASALDATATLPALRAALTTPEPDPVAYGGVTGRACHLDMGVPLAFHILSRATSFAQATELNIRAGGDSAGRAIVIGAVMGARHGIGGDWGIPLDWALRLHDGATVWADCQHLAGTVTRPA